RRPMGAGWGWGAERARTALSAALRTTKALALVRGQGSSGAWGRQGLRRRRHLARWAAERQSRSDIVTLLRVVDLLDRSCCELEARYDVLGLEVWEGREGFL